MGALQSTPAPEQLVIGGGLALVVGALAYGAQNPGQEQPTPAQPASSEKAAAKKGKKKKTAASSPPPEPSGTITPPAIAQSAKLFTESQLNDSIVSESGSVGKKNKKKNKAKEASLTGADASSAVESGVESASGVGSGTEAAKKKKKKAKAKSPLAQSEAPPQAVDPSMEASTFNDMGSSWTHVTSRRGKSSKKPNLHTLEGSDTGVTTSVTEESQEQDDEPSTQPDNVRTFAEKMLPKPRKTAVDDMLETPDQPQLARVMRVTSGSDSPPQKPEGVSWGDYEDAGDVADGDAEDDDGWGIVTNRKPRSNRPRPDEPLTQSMTSSTSSIPGAPEKLTKHQKQNVARREAQKQAKAEAETDRLERLAKHRKEQEKARIEEMYKKSGKGSGSKVGGGMTSSVQNGALVWE